MVDNNKTELVIVLDRSGSMEAIKADMEGGFMTLIEEQKQVPGECVVSLYQFDNKYEIKYEEKPLTEITGLGLEPRGSTALLDGLGKAIVNIGERLAAKPEEQRPGGVVVMVITDGHENASREYNKKAIKAKVQEQESKYNWKFVFLGADMGAFAEANSMGINVAAMYSADAIGVSKAFGANSHALRQYRSDVTKDGNAGASYIIPKDLTSKS